MFERLLFKLHVFRNSRFTYAYSLFFDCVFYDFDFEEGDLCLK